MEKYPIDVHLAAARLAQKQQRHYVAKQEVEASLGLLRQVGYPRLVAYALLFYGKLEIATHDRNRLLQRALVIYRTLEDVKGQRACLLALTKIGSHVDNSKVRYAP